MLYDIRSRLLRVPAARAFSYIRDRNRVTEWAEAFEKVDNQGAQLRTPQGAVRIGLEVRANADSGTVDWIMSFPDGSTGVAYSRVVDLDEDTCVYSFVLTPPPVALEMLEGALEQQSKILVRELDRLARNLEAAA